MDQKRELSSIDLAALVTELNRYEGAKVDKAYLYDDDLLRLKLRDFDRGRVELMIEVGDIKRAHVADPENVADAPGRPPNFAKMLRNRMSGADFAGRRAVRIRPDPHVRVRARGREHDARRRAVRTGERRRARRDRRGRRVAPDRPAQVPDGRARRAIRVPASRLNPLDVSLGGFKRHMRESDSDVVRTLATQLNLGGLYAEEVCVYPRRRREGRRRSTT